LLASSAAVVKRSPVRYDVPAGAAGTLELAEPYDPAWRMGSVAPTRTPQGTMSFPIGPEAETIGFTHWPVALAGDLISVGTALTLIAGLAVGRRRRRRLHSPDTAAGVHRQVAPVDPVSATQPPGGTS